MNENHQTELKHHRIDPYEDEIELMDYLLVIWKWKYLILFGTLVCAIIAFIISFTMPKNPEIYPIDMVLEPGVKKINNEGKEVYISSPAEIKGLIEIGIFNNQILNSIKGSNVKNLPVSLNFKVTVPDNVNMVKISYETSNVDEGIKILNLLNKALLAKYNERIKYLQKEYEKSIRLKKSKLDDLIAQKERYTKEYENGIRLKKSKLDDLIAQKERYKKEYENSILLKKSKLDDLIAQKEQIETVSREISELEKAKTNSQAIHIFQPELFKIQKQIEAVSKEIDDLEKEKTNIQNIKTIQPPTAKSLPLPKSKTKRNTILASFVGLFLMVFLAFFLEYINKYKKSLDKKTPIIQADHEKQVRNNMT